MRLPKPNDLWLRDRARRTQVDWLSNAARSARSADAVVPPDPEYIAETAPVPDEIWADEEARARAKRDGDGSSDPPDAAA
jgi:hypothetical protein